MGEFKCELCGAESMVRWSCQECHRGVCTLHIEEKDGRQLCSDCAHPKEKVAA